MCSKRGQKCAIEKYSIRQKSNVTNLVCTVRSRILFDIATVAAKKNCDGNEKILHTDTQKNWIIRMQFCVVLRRFEKERKKWSVLLPLYWSQSRDQRQKIFYYECEMNILYKDDNKSYG